MMSGINVEKMNVDTAKISYAINSEIKANLKFFTDEEHVRREWKQTAEINMTQSTFLEGMLLKTLDNKTESPYRYVDYAVFCSGLGLSCSNNIPHSGVKHGSGHANSRSYNRVNNMGRVVNTYGKSASDPALRSPLLEGTGFYDELEYILRSDVKPLPRTPVSKDSVYFLSAFQTDGHLPSLEQSWKTWSGADFILWKCPSKLKLRRVTFLKTTFDQDPYTFIVLCECEEGLNFRSTAQEFVEKLKDRRCGLVGLFQVERYYISSRTKT